MRRSTISNTYLHSAVLVVTVSVSGRYCDLTWAGHCYSRLTVAFQAFIQHNNTKSHIDTMQVCIAFIVLLILWSVFVYFFAQ